MGRDGDGWGRTAGRGTSSVIGPITGSIRFFPTSFCSRTDFPQNGFLVSSIGHSLAVERLAFNQAVRGSTPRVRVKHQFFLPPRRPPLVVVQWKIQRMAGNAQALLRLLQAVLSGSVSSTQWGEQTE